MVTFFVLLLAAVLVWLFAESKTTRIVGLSIVAAITALVVGYMVWRETWDGRNNAKSDSPARSEASQAEKFEQSLTALQPSDIALSAIKLESGVETYSGIDGKQYQRPDLSRWKLTGEMRNQSTKYTVKDVILRVRLYSCPTYFTTPVEEVKFEELSMICSRIGERSVGLYDVNVAPQASKSFAEALNFPNQGNALNWRFWVDVARVVAKLE